MATVFNKIFVNKQLLLNTENINFKDPAARFKLIYIYKIYNILRLSPNTKEG